MLSCYGIYYIPNICQREISRIVSNFIRTYKWNWVSFYWLNCKRFAYRCSTSHYISCVQKTTNCGLGMTHVALVVHKREGLEYFCICWMLHNQPPPSWRCTDMTSVILWGWASCTTGQFCKLCGILSLTFRVAAMRVTALESVSVTPV